MNPREFFEKVAAMRAAQKGFFASVKGSPERGKFYAESKKLEAEIDSEIERVKQLLPTLNQ